MVVVEVKEASVGDSSTSSGTDTASATRAFRAHFKVRAERGDSSEVVDDYFRSTSNLPYMGRNFDFGNGSDNKSKCRRLTVTTIDKSEGYFNVEAEFEEQTINLGDPAKKDGQGQPTTNPFQWHDELDISSTQISVPVQAATFLGAFDSAGNVSADAGELTFGELGPVANSAGIPLEPGIEEELDILIFRLTKYQPFYNVNFVNQYLGTVNKDMVVILKPNYNFFAWIPPKKAKLKAIHSTFAVTDKGVRYWRHTLEVHVNPQGWDRILLDQGLSVTRRMGDKAPNGDTISATDLPMMANGTRRNVVEIPLVDPVEGVPLGEPVPFNGNGEPNIDPKTSPKVFLIYQTLRTVPWGGIIW